MEVVTLTSKCRIILTGNYGIIIIIIIKTAILGTSHIIRNVLQCEA